MTGSGPSGYVDVEDGKETPFDIHLGKPRVHHPENADRRLARKLREVAEKEDKVVKAGGKPDDAEKLAPSKRPETPAGKLLDELAEQNSGPDRFKDVWRAPLKASSLSVQTLCRN